MSHWLLGEEDRFMRRRSLLLGTAWLVGVLLGCLADIGSAKERYHVGVVSFGVGQREVVIGMQEGMRELGYEEGKNIAYTIVEANWTKGCGRPPKSSYATRLMPCTPPQRPSQSRLRGSSRTFPSYSTSSAIQWARGL